MLGSSCRALRAVEKAQALFVCRASVFFGAQVPRGEEARLRENGERSSRSRKSTAVERTSVFVATHSPSRGDAGSGGLCGGSSHARVGQTTRCKQNARGVPPLVALLARRKRCAELVRGGASPAETTARTFTRLGPVRTGVCFFGSRRNAARQPALPPRGGRRRQRRGEGRHLPAQHEEPKQLAVSAHASSYCRSRRNALGFREACHR